MLSGFLLAGYLEYSPLPTSSGLVLSFNDEELRIDQIHYIFGAGGTSTSYLLILHSKVYWCPTFKIPQVTGQLSLVS